METVSERRRKRIIEYIISGFPVAIDAVNFAKAIKIMAEKNIGTFKFHTEIAGENTDLAITKEWKNPTILKIVFLEIDQEKMMFVQQGTRQTIKKNGYKLEQEILREKPQAQTITIEQIPSTLIMNRIG